jgi:hypothetical protein
MLCVSQCLRNVSPQAVHGAVIGTGRDYLDIAETRVSKYSLHPGARRRCHWRQSFAPFESFVGITGLEYQNIDSLLQCAKQVERIELGGSIPIVGSRRRQDMMKDREKQRHVNRTEAADERWSNCGPAEFEVRPGLLLRHITVALNDDIIGINADIARDYIRPLETKIAAAAAEVHNALPGKINMVLYETTSSIHSSLRQGSGYFSPRVSSFLAAGVGVIPQTLVQSHRHDIPPYRLNFGIALAAPLELLWKPCPSPARKLRPSSKPRLVQRR